MFHSAFSFVLNLDLLLLSIMGIGILLMLKCPRFSMKLLSFVTIIFFTIGSTSIGKWPAVYLENFYKENPVIPDDVGGFILLGGYFNIKVSKQRNQAVFNKAASRVFSFISLVKKYPNKKIYFSGTRLEADFTRKIFKEFGLANREVIFDDEAENTEQNAKNIVNMVGLNAEKPFVLVTSAFHLPRSTHLYESLGLKIIPYPVDYHTPGDYGISLDRGGFSYWFMSMKEWAGLVNYYFDGKTKTLLPVYKR